MVGVGKTDWANSVAVGVEGANGEAAIDVGVGVCVAVGVITIVIAGIFVGIGVDVSRWLGLGATDERGGIIASQSTNLLSRSYNLISSLVKTHELRLM